ncbi:MAG: DinB family protein, partial [Acidobacteriota bacterium]
MIGRPLEGEHNPYYSKYISLVTEGELLAVLEKQPNEVREFVVRLSPDRENHRYAEGKWSVRQVIGHMTDAERVFGYRAFRISRGDETPLSGFDENLFVERSPYAGVPAKELAEEFALVRAANLAFFRQLDPSRWPLKGTAN